MSTSRTYTAGNGLTAAQVTDLAQGTLGYASVTTSQGTFTAATDLTNLTVTVTLVAGRRIKITGSVQIQSSVAADDVFFSIQEGATVLNQQNFDLARANFPYPGHMSIVLTPAAGSHTYKLAAQRNAGTGNITMAADATHPAFILVEDIGT